MNICNTDIINHKNLFMLNMLKTFVNKKAYVKKAEVYAFCFDFSISNHYRENS